MNSTPCPSASFHSGGNPECEKPQGNAAKKTRRDASFKEGRPAAQFIRRKSDTGTRPRRARGNTGRDGAPPLPVRFSKPILSTLKHVVQRVAVKLPRQLPAAGGHPRGIAGKGIQLIVILPRL